jgi:septal ring-binding cell division protein DamX
MKILNLANAAVIIACIYFIFQVQNIWAKIGLIVLLLFAIATWGLYSIDKEIKKAIIEEAESKIRLNNSNAAFTTANALYLREQALWYRRNRK